MVNSLNRRKFLEGLVLWPLMLESSLALGEDFMKTPNGNYNLEGLTVEHESNRNVDFLRRNSLPKKRLDSLSPLVVLTENYDLMAQTGSDGGMIYLSFSKENTKSDSGEKRTTYGGFIVDEQPLNEIVRIKLERGMVYITCDGIDIPKINFGCESIGSVTAGASSVRYNFGQVIEKRQNPSNTQVSTDLIVGSEVAGSASMLFTEMGNVERMYSN